MLFGRAFCLKSKREYLNVRYEPSLLWFHVRFEINNAVQDGSDEEAF